jgi:NTP pyrophosphohydrolases including oxidative damage repair enzymes
MTDSFGSSTVNGKTAQSLPLPDYKKIDYRGFVFVIHNTHGMLLLHCTRKPKKGPHYQLPGGHVDDFEFEHAAKQYENKDTSASPAVVVNKILLEAARMGTARELFEETGMDVRAQLHRLEPVRLYKDGDGTFLENALQNKLYFFLNVTDKDFFTGTQDEDEAALTYPHGESGKHLGLKISHEHSGFMFENNPLDSIEKLAKHSGGAGGMALRMSMQPRRLEQKRTTGTPTNTGDVASVGKYQKSVPDWLPSQHQNRGFHHGLFSCCFYADDCC